MCIRSCQTILSAFSRAAPVENAQMSAHFNNLLHLSCRYRDFDCLLLPYKSMLHAYALKNGRFFNLTTDMFKVHKKSEWRPRSTRDGRRHQLLTS
jgi:hypothetical protein